MKIFVCDDELIETTITKKIIDGYLKDNKIESEVLYKNPDDIVKEVEDKRFDYDIAILDIDFKVDDFNGIDLGHIINENYPLCIVIYLTAILDFASDVYETEHCYFVMKNNQEITLKRALDKAISLHRINSEKKSISIISEGKNITIPVWDIHYITREGRKIKICCGDIEHDSYISLNDILKQLPDKFVRCHTGYIVNYDYIRRVESNVLYMDEDYEIPIGRIYKESFMLKYIDYLEGRV